MPLQGLSQHVVVYTWRGRPVRVLLNPYTGLPTAAEIDSAYPDDVFWGVGGDVTTRISYSFWDLLPGGLHYPLQWDVARRGLPDRTLMITHLALNPTLPGDTFALPEDASGGYADAVAHGPDYPPLGSPARPPVTLGRRGRLHSRALGRHAGPPGRRCGRARGAHLGRLRAQGNGRGRAAVPGPADQGGGHDIRRVAALRRRSRICLRRRARVRARPQRAADRRALDRRHTRHPDTLERSPRPPILRVVAGRTPVGAGPNRVELYPVRSETGERMMMAYLPERRLLYASDLVQLGRGGPPQYVSELVWAAEREGLKVERLFAMHTDPTDWSRILDIARGHLLDRRGPLHPAWLLACGAPAPRAARRSFRRPSVGVPWAFRGHSARIAQWSARP